MKKAVKALILRWARHIEKKPPKVAAAFSLPLLGLARPIIKPAAKALASAGLIFKAKKRRKTRVIWSFFNSTVFHLFFFFFNFPWSKRKVLPVVFCPFLLSKTWHCVLLIAFKLINCVLQFPLPCWSHLHELTWPTQHFALFCFIAFVVILSGLPYGLEPVPWPFMSRPAYERPEK